jgi:hypothetical protein
MVSSPGCITLFLGLQHPLFALAEGEKATSIAGLTPSAAEDDRGVFLRELRDFA